MTKREEFERSMKDFEERRSLMKPEVASGSQERLRGVAQNLEKDYKNVKMELSKIEAEYMEEILKIIYDEANKIAAAEKYDYVFEKKSLLFGGEDITEKVMKVLKSKKPAPKKETKDSKKGK